MPKSQANSPIDLDVLLVCRKKQDDFRVRIDTNEAFDIARCTAAGKIERFNHLGRFLSQNDVKVVFFSQLLVELSPGRDHREFLTSLNTLMLGSSNVLEELWSAQTQQSAYGPRSAVQQLALFEERERYDSITSNVESDY